MSKAYSGLTARVMLNGVLIGYINSVTLNLDSIEGVEDFQYVRAEVFGDGGMCLTQALVIEDGEGTKEFETEKGLIPFIQKVLFILKSTRLWTIIVELFRMI